MMLVVEAMLLTVTIDMGDMGKIKFDQGVGGNGAAAIR